MADSKPSSRQTYAEAMAEWAALNEAKRALLSKSRNTLLSPDPMGTPLVRFCGWLWRLAALVAIVAIGYYIAIQWYLRSEGFSQVLAGGATEYLGAEKVTLQPLSWRGEKGVTRRLSATGGAGSPFRSFEAEDVQFKLPMRMILGKKWELPSLSVGALTAELRSGALGSATSAPPLSAAEKERLPDGAAPVKADFQVPTLSTDEPAAPPPAKPAGDAETDSGKGKPLDLRLKRDGMGIAPDFSQLVISQFDIARATISWGSSPVTRGGIDGAAVMLLRNGPEQWQMDASGGTLRQNWLKDLAINNLTVTYDGKALDFSKGELSVGPSGKASLSGRIVMEKNPRLDLRFTGDHLPLTAFLPETFAKYIRANGSMEASLGGSPNLSTGVTSSGVMKIESGTLRELPIFDTLAIVTSRTRFRDIEITGGTLKFSTQGGAFESPEVSLQSRNDIMIQGAVRAEGQLVAGNLYIGMSAELAQRVAEPLRKTFFRESDGWLVLPVPLDGRIDQLTKDLSTRLATAYQALPR